jgi:hypothetical protein
MLPEERLRFHQDQSKPVMDRLKAWMDAQITEKKTEPNSGLGKAIEYCRKRRRRRPAAACRPWEEPREPARPCPSRTAAGAGPAATSRFSGSRGTSPPVGADRTPGCRDPTDLAAIRI